MKITSALDVIPEEEVKGRKVYSVMRVVIGIQQKGA